MEPDVLETAARSTYLSQSQTRSLLLLARALSRLEHPNRAQPAPARKGQEQGLAVGIQSISSHTPTSTAHTNPVTVRCWDLQKLDGHSPSHRRRDQHSKSLSIPPGRARHYTIPRYIHTQTGHRSIVRDTCVQHRPSFDSTRFPLGTRHDRGTGLPGPADPAQGSFFSLLLLCWLESDKTD